MAGGEHAIPETADVLVVGGGINGISVFRELALQGVDVVLIERQDFCSGASAALSRMVHGGLRYLENGELSLVWESLVERDRLLRNAPHMVFPLATVVPIASWHRGAFSAIASFFGAPRKQGPRPGTLIRLGLFLYDMLSIRSRSMPFHKGLSRTAIRKLVPGITEEAVGGVLYYDARVTLPERLGIELILDTEAASRSRAFNYVELEGLNGEALVWHDKITGATGEITPRLVINATGAWVDHVEAILRPGQNRRRVQGTKGSHLMIRNEQLQGALADRMIYYENDDGRICIAFNHLGAAMVGSTDIRIDNPDDAVCEADEKTYMLSALRSVLPGIRISDEDIVHVFTGVRPLPFGEAGSTARISRDHSVEEDEPGHVPWPVLTLIGGKWTTFRAFGAEVADIALKRLGVRRKQQTVDMPIGGGKGFPADERRRQEWNLKQSNELGFDRARFALLAERYGSRAIEAARYIKEAPDAQLGSAPDYWRREIEWLVISERVRDLQDVVLRRTSLGIQGRIDDAVIREMADIVAGTLGWTGPQKEAAIERLKSVLERRHRVLRNPASS
jgi:glycerol-3-phosphate dehydrogenase